MSPLLKDYFNVRDFDKRNAPPETNLKFLYIKLLRSVVTYSDIIITITFYSISHLFLYPQSLSNSLIHTSLLETFLPNQTVLTPFQTFQNLEQSQI